MENEDCLKGTYLDILRKTKEGEWNPTAVPYGVLAEVFRVRGHMVKIPDKNDKDKGTSSKAKFVYTRAEFTKDHTLLDVHPNEEALVHALMLCNALGVHPIVSAKTMGKTGGRSIFPGYQLYARDFVGLFQWCKGRSEMDRDADKPGYGGNFDKSFKAHVRKLGVLEDYTIRSTDTTNDGPGDEAGQYSDVHYDEDDDMHMDSDD